jgi:hypothetical protein
MQRLVLSQWTKYFVDVWCGSECHLVGLLVDVTSRQRSCPCSMTVSMLRVHVQDAISTPLLSISLSILYVHIQAHVHVHVLSMVNDYVHAASPCYMSTFLSMLHVHIHAACSFPCYMFMSMLHSMSTPILHVFVACPCVLSLLFVHVHFHGHGHGTWT